MCLLRAGPWPAAARPGRSGTRRGRRPGAAAAAPTQRPPSTPARALRTPRRRRRRARRRARRASLRRSGRRAKAQHGGVRERPTAAAANERTVGGRAAQRQAGRRVAPCGGGCGAHAARAHAACACSCGADGTARRERSQALRGLWLHGTGAGAACARLRCTGDARRNGRSICASVLSNAELARRSCAWLAACRTHDHQSPIPIRKIAAQYKPRAALSCSACVQTMPPRSTIRQYVCCVCVVCCVPRRAVRSRFAQTPRVEMNARGRPGCARRPPRRIHTGTAGCAPASSSSSAALEPCCFIMG